MNSALRAIVLKTLVLLFFLGVCLTHSQAQTMKDRVVKVRPWPDSPVELISISSNFGKINNKESFTADETWLQGLSLQLKNNSKKTVIGIRYTLLLPNIEGKDLPLGVPVGFGYQQAIEDEYIEPNTASIPPDGDIIVSLDEETYKDIIAAVERTESKSMANVNTAVLILQEVIFDNDTCWVAGSILPVNKAK